MGVILAFCSSLLCGIGDFSGGFATKKNSVFTVMFYSQLAGALLALVASPLVGYQTLTNFDFFWGMVAGLGGITGLIFLYSGLSQYSAAIVSPISALVCTLVPVTVGFLSGERLPPLALSGCVICVMAILLISYEKPGHQSRKNLGWSVLYGIASGLGFGWFFVTIARTGSGSGLWPLVAARAASLSLALVVILAGKKSLTIHSSDRLTTALSGLADMGANILFLLASRYQYLVLVSVVTSLYPVPTVILSRIFLGQKISLLRMAGIVCAITGITFISIGQK